jgi:hypothetical protein
MLQGQIKDDKIYFSEVKPKPFRPERLQSAMFCDRPDLWKKLPSKKVKPVSKDQASLF